MTAGAFTVDRRTHGRRVVAAFVPHPPLLVPALAAGAAPEVLTLLESCEAAVAVLLTPSPHTVICVGGGSRTAIHPVSAWGSLAGYGVDVAAPEVHDPAEATLPLSLTIGRWLLDRAGWRGDTVLQEIDVEARPDDCAAVGRSLAADAGDGPAWLVLGEGAATRSERAPGYFDARAQGFDASVALALADGDPAALTGLDPALAAAVGAAGRAAWQVLAAGVGDRPMTRARLRFDAAPYGVGYLVANWWS